MALGEVKTADGTCRTSQKDNTQMEQCGRHDATSCSKEVTVGPIGPSSHCLGLLATPKDSLRSQAWLQKAGSPHVLFTILWSLTLRALHPRDPRVTSAPQQPPLLPAPEAPLLAPSLPFPLL